MIFIHMGKRLIRECIIIGGEDASGHVLGKTRDRNYRPNLEVVRDLTEDGIEVVYIHDLDTNYLEGMNSEGIGIVNAALLVSEDEAAADKFWSRRKKKGNSNDGPRIAKALTYPRLSQAIKSIVGWDNGLKGHTIVGSPKALYSVEMTSKHNPIVKKLNPGTGFDVRTNHGEGHPNAGYTPTGFPEDYVSSKVRKASAATAIANIDNYEELMPAIASQQFDKNSNYNTMRKVDDGMRSSSQVMMHLDKLELLCYLIPGECTFNGVVDKTPDDYEPRIKINVKEYKEDE